ncbi:MAG: aminoacyl-tRNA hydrolase [Acidobacteria bacterium]|jgi:PTH1 family peptidyl-tRNA hydrolase|nr:MAG: aminoacyl-tRNA hydrolase [Acidobacteriota bacterium]GIU82156.1 MAG: peptidyl-tRNA hydrolase [Pyrinomonadaceae bacterium]
MQTIENWLVIGLGNPGKEYEKTRHNLGFMLVDLLASQANIQIKREECRSLVGLIKIENRQVELVKPQTYMNLSGEAVACLLQKPSRSIERMIVITDDLALPFGRIRVRARGSAGGHNGLKSIINCLRTDNFIRLRIGIKPDHPISDTRNFVLENFSTRDLEKLEKILQKSADAVRTTICEGVEKAMSKFNSIKEEL